ncbi:MAG: cytochrome c family protein [Myxococcaceae bacterium]|nr:cytochrome c family protein [Myxococcaceae bacterium]
MRSVFALAGAAVLAASVPALAADFMGPESCKACHPEAYAAWKSSKHARAFESLSQREKGDARCTTCHAPNLDQQVTSVSCETCHGGGQYYSPDYVMRDPELARLVGLNDPSEKECRTCHDASSPSLQPFDFVEKLKLIDHWTAERQRRQGKVDPKALPEKKSARREEAPTRPVRAGSAEGRYRHRLDRVIALMAAPVAPKQARP